MLATSKEIEKLEKSAVKLTITIGSEESAKSYDELLKKYAKTAHIKGFRKGKVPPAVLEKKYGEGLLHETAFNLIEESLKEVLEDIEDKPLHYSTPELQDEEVKLELGKDFSFTVKYDIFPEITVGEYKGIEVTEPVVKVLKADIDRELKSIQDQNSTIIEKDGGEVAKDDIVTLDYCELEDDDSVKEESKREDFVFTVGSGYNLYKIDDDIIGMKKDDEKVIEKEFPEDYDYSDLAGKKVRLKVTVKVIKEKQLPALDDELAQDVSDDYETLDDLKKSIKERLEKTRDSRLRSDKITALLDKIVENSTMDLPESMIQMELDNQWNNFLMQSRMQEEQLLQILEAQGKTKEEYLEEWKPGSEKNLKRQLIINRLVDDEKIEVSDEELEEQYVKQAELSGTTVEQLKEQVAAGNMTEYFKSDVKTEKLFDFLLENASLKKGEKISYLDLVQKNQ